MNVASLELCKELGELSRWGNPDSEDSDSMYTWCRNKGEKLEPWSPTARSEYSFPGFEDTDIPAYDLGYLLRKLPEEVFGDTLNLMVDLDYGIRAGKWECGYEDLFVNADTPEDAAAKLAVELFKRDVLTRS